jgi:hypothetical protein
VVNSINEISIQDELERVFAYGLLNPFLALKPMNPQELLEGVLAYGKSLGGHEVLWPQANC